MLHSQTQMVAMYHEIAISINCITGLGEQPSDKPCSALHSPPAKLLSFLSCLVGMVKYFSCIHAYRKGNPMIHTSVQ